MLILDNFLKLSEDEMIDNLCDEVWLYVESCLRKYIGRFHDFDAAAFIPMLEERIKYIKENFHKGNKSTKMPRLDCFIIVSVTTIRMQGVISAKTR